MSKPDMTWSCNASDAFNLETLTREAPTTRVNFIGSRGDNAPAVEAMALREVVMGRVPRVSQTGGGTMETFDGPYWVQEILAGRIVAEVGYDDAREAIKRAEEHDADRQGDSVRVLCDGEIVWPNVLRCSTCGNYLRQENAPCPDGCSP